MARLRYALLAMRPRQWTKNLLLFAGLIFARELDHRTAWVRATAAFVAYCAASSASYLLNDVRDAEHDRRHELKRHRPVAAGLLRERDALGVAALLAVVACVIGARLGASSVALLGTFLAAQLAYSLGLKRIVGVDLAVIAGLFVVRAVAGAVAVHVFISGWLIACTILLSAFLGLSKRRAELEQVRLGATAGRTVLEHYRVEVVERFVIATATIAFTAYVIYAVLGPTPWMVVTTPLVAVGLHRYVRLTHRGTLGESPEEILLTDPVIIGSVLGWVASAAIVLVAT